MLAWFIRESEAVYKNRGRDAPQRSLTYWITEKISSSNRMPTTERHCGDRIRYRLLR